MLWSNDEIAALKGTVESNRNWNYREKNVEYLVDLGIVWILLNPLDCVESISASYCEFRFPRCSRSKLEIVNNVSICPFEPANKCSYHQHWPNVGGGRTCVLSHLKWPAYRHQYIPTRWSSAGNPKIFRTRVLVPHNSQGVWTVEIFG